VPDAALSRVDVGTTAVGYTSFFPVFSYAPPETSRARLEPDDTAGTTAGEDAGFAFPCVPRPRLPVPDAPCSIGLVSGPRQAGSFGSPLISLPETSRARQFSLSWLMVRDHGGQGGYGHFLPARDYDPRKGTGLVTMVLDGSVTMLAP
jgi:hypothetical protein